MKVVATVRIDAASARLVAAVNSEFDSPIVSEFEEVNQYGFIRAEISGLEADTEYFLGVQEPDAEIGSFTGRFRTPPSGAHSFSFAAASCSTTGSNEMIFDAIRARAESDDIAFFIHMGDLHYEDIDVNDEALFHAAFDQVFGSPRQKDLWAKLPMYYIWDDHDFGPNNSGRDNPARQAAVAAYRRRVPSPSLAQSGSESAPYFSFVRGRVRFIVTDVRSERAEQGEFNSTDPDQVVFTNTQRNWLFAEMLAAQSADQAIIWVNSKPWVAAVTNGADHWGGYDAARQEIASFVDANELNRRIAILSGDMHALAYDDGSSVHNAACVRVLQAAALDRAGSNKGGPYTTGPIRSPASGAVSQYGLVDITDAAGEGDVSVRFRGISINRTNGAETTQIDVSFDLGDNLP